MAIFGNISEKYSYLGCLEFFDTEYIKTFPIKSPSMIYLK